MSDMCGGSRMRRSSSRASGLMIGRCRGKRPTVASSLSRWAATLVLQTAEFIRHYGDGESSSEDWIRLRSHVLILLTIFGWATARSSATISSAAR